VAIQTDPQYRPRFTPEIVSGDAYAVLGDITPDQTYLETLPHSYYRYHPGDFFVPGAPGWVLDQKWENPLMCIWGNGLLLAPNRGFQPFPSTPPIDCGFIERTARPWGTSSPGWIVPVMQEMSAEIQDTEGFQPLANIDFQQTVSGDY
jgi:hypothetical protein